MLPAASTVPAADHTLLVCCELFQRGTCTAQHTTRKAPNQGKLQSNQPVHTAPDEDSIHGCHHCIRATGNRKQHDHRGEPGFAAQHNTFQKQPRGFHMCAHTTRPCHSCTQPSLQCRQSAARPNQTASAAYMNTASCTCVKVCRHTKPAMHSCQKPSPVSCSTTECAAGSRDNGHHMPAQQEQLSTRCRFVGQHRQHGM